MADPFIFPVPAKLATDPELAPYFNYLSKVLHDLTAILGPVISNPTGGGTIDVEARDSIDAILEQLRTDKTIDT